MQFDQISIYNHTYHLGINLLKGHYEGIYKLRVPLYILPGHFTGLASALGEDNSMLECIDYYFDATF